MIVAEIRVVPLGEGTSMHEAVSRAVGALEQAGVDFEVGPLGTTVEAPQLDQLLEAVKRAHEAACRDADRVITTVTIDHRLDRQETADSLAHAEPRP